MNVLNSSLRLSYTTHELLASTVFDIIQIGFLMLAMHVWEGGQGVWHFQFAIYQRVATCQQINKFAKKKSVLVIPIIEKY